MSNVTFDEFVKRRLDEAKENRAKESVDWDKMRTDWEETLIELFAKMEGYLQEYIDSGRISVTREKTKVSEEHLGLYEVDKLTFHIGNERVVAKPIGRLMIGAQGRVDLIGPRGVLRIVVLEEGGPFLRTRIEIDDKVEEETERPLISAGDIPKAGWYISTIPPRVTTTALNKDSFRDALMELSDV